MKLNLGLLLSLTLAGSAWSACNPGQNGFSQTVYACYPEGEYQTFVYQCNDGDYSHCADDGATNAGSYCQVNTFIGACPDCAAICQTFNGSTGSCSGGCATGSSCKSGGCVVDCVPDGSCTATPSCGQTHVHGFDNCTNDCYRDGPSCTALSVSGQASGNGAPPYIYPNVTYVNASATSNVPANCAVSVNGGAAVGASGSGTTTNYRTFGDGSTSLAMGTYTADFQCTATGANNGTGTASTTVSFTVQPAKSLTLSGQTAANVPAPYKFPNVTYVNAFVTSNVAADCTVSVNGGAAAVASGAGTTTNYRTFGTGNSPLAVGTYDANFTCAATGASNGSGTASSDVKFTVVASTGSCTANDQCLPGKYCGVTKVCQDVPTGIVFDQPANGASQSAYQPFNISGHIVGGQGTIGIHIDVVNGPGICVGGATCIGQYIAQATGTVKVSAVAYATDVTNNFLPVGTSQQLTLNIVPLNIVALTVNPSPAEIWIHSGSLTFSASAQNASGGTYYLPPPLNMSWTTTGGCGTITPAGGVFRPLTVGTTCQVSATLNGPKGTLSGVISSTAPLTVYADPTWTYYAVISTAPVPTPITAVKQGVNVTLVAQLTNSTSTVKMDWVEFNSGDGVIRYGQSGGSCPVNAYCAVVTDLTAGQSSFTATPKHGFTYFPSTVSAINVLVTPKGTVSLALSPFTASSHYLAGSTVTLTATLVNFSSDEVRVVTFFSDGYQPVGMSTGYPYTAKYFPIGPLSFSHNLSAVVTDLQGVDTPSAPISITVDVPPLLFGSPTDSYSFVNGTATFTAALLGSVPMTFQWQRAPAKNPTAFVNLGGPTTGQYNATYDLTPLTLADDGSIFRLKASNGFGSPVTTSTAALHVSALASPQLRISSGTAMAGQNSSLAVNYGAGAFPARAASAQISLPPGVSFSSVTLNSAYVPPSTTVSTATLGGDLLLFVTAPSAFSNGDLLQLNLHISTSALAGTYPVLLSSVTFTRTNTGVVGGNAISGALTITALSIVAPVIAISTPAADSTVSGTVVVAGTVTTAPGIALSAVTFAVDGSSIASGTSATFQFFWDTLQVQNGSHTLTLEATDLNNQTRSATLPVTVFNSLLLLQPTTAEIDVTVLTSSGVPVSSAAITIAGDPLFTAPSSTLTDSNGNAKILIQLTSSTVSVSPQLTLTDAAHSVTLSTTVLSLQGGEIRAVLFVEPISSVTLPTLTAIPVVTLAPPLPAMVHGLVTLSGTVQTDPTVNFSSITLAIDGVSTATVVVSTFQFTWDSTKVADGSHTLTLSAFDSLGQVGILSGVVQVVNTAEVDVTVLNASSVPVQGVVVTAGADPLFALQAPGVTDASGVSKLIFAFATNAASISPALTITDSANPPALSSSIVNLQRGDHRAITIVEGVVFVPPQACAATAACGAGTYCAPTAFCLPIPSGTILFSSPQHGAIVKPDVNVSFAAAVMGVSTTTLAPSLFTMALDTAPVCSGPGLCSVTHVFTGVDVGTHTLLATAFLFDIQGASISIASPVSLAFVVIPDLPVIQSLGVPALTAGDANTTISVKGLDFSPGMTIFVNGQAQPTVFVSPTQVNVTISATFFEDIGVLQLSLRDIAWPSATPGSAPATLQIVPPPHVPQLGSLPTRVPLDATLDLPNEAYPTVFTWSFSPRASAGSAQARNAHSADGPHSLATPTPSLSLGALHLDPGSYQLEVTETNLAGRVSAPGTVALALFTNTLGDVLVYPNPWRADLNSSKPITFGGIPSGSTVKIFSLSGHWIQTVQESGGVATWDLKNDSGDRVQSGLYLYLITDLQNQKTRGKFAIIR
jgi:hypothetical protein